MSVSTMQDTIVLFGDSITQAGWDIGGFAQKLAQAYCRKMDIINRGFGGYNTAWAIPIFRQIFAKKDHQAFLPKCKLLTIWLGANDSVLPGNLQFIPLDTFKSNITWMVRSLRETESECYAPWTRIILITPPPIHEATRANELARRAPPRELDRSTENTKAYVEATKEVATTEGLPVLNAWDAIWDAAKHETGNLTTFLSDGLHLTKEGYEVIYDELMKVISKEYPELHPDKLSPVFPWWADLDSKDPGASIVSHYVDV